MVKRKEIRISIDKLGNVLLEPIGARGSECLDWTKEIEEALGTTTSRELKPEYYESDLNELTTSTGGNDDGEP